MIIYLLERHGQVGGIGWLLLRNCVEKRSGVSEGALLQGSWHIGGSEPYIQIDSYGG